MRDSGAAGGQLADDSWKSLPPNLSVYADAALINESFRDGIFKVRRASRGHGYVFARKWFRSEASGGCIKSQEACVTKSTKRGWTQSDASRWCGKQPLSK